MMFLKYEQYESNVTTQNPCDVVSSTTKKCSIQRWIKVTCTRDCQRRISSETYRPEDGLPSPNTWCFTCGLTTRLESISARVWSASRRGRRKDTAKGKRRRASASSWSFSAAMEELHQKWIQRSGCLDSETTGTQTRYLECHIQ